MTPTSTAGLLDRRVDKVLIASFDRLDLAAALLDADGHVRESTARLRTLLRLDGELMSLFRAPGSLLGRSGLPVGGAGCRPLVPRCHRSQLTTGAGRYLLRASWIGDVAPAPRCMVLVSTMAAAATELPCCADLVAAYRLTSREAEVALLLAEGASDRDVARGLNISPHTARKHTEHVLQKLGINSRKALGWRLVSRYRAAPRP